MVNMKRVVLIAAFTVFMVSASIPAARAAGMEDENWTTLTTFNAPVSVGHMVLVPGTYEFRLADSPFSRNVISIYNVDEKRWVGMVMGINDRRADTSKMSGFTFMDMGSGAPKALEYWYFQDWNMGIKLVYPRAQATEKMAAFFAPRAR